MRRNKFLFCVLCLSTLINPGSLSGQARTRQPAIVPHPYVDERVELLSIVFRLAGNPEYNMDTLPAYATEIDRYFAPYKNQPAVRMAAKLRRENGVGFDAVMAMAITISSPPKLKPLVPFSSTVPEARWGEENAAKFLSMLRDFYRQTKFADFYAAHRKLYQLAEERFAATLSSVDFGWYSRFYGASHVLRYHLILAMNNGGGNYGPRLIHSDGSMELFSITGCWTHDDAGNPTYPKDRGYLSTVIHEFNHSFVNPAVSGQWNEFSGAEDVFRAVQGQMRSLAYGNAETMVYESLVRAAVIIYFQDAGEDSQGILRRIRAEQRNGFVWMRQLVDKLTKYETERTKYPTFADFMPQIATFFRELAPKVPAEVVAYNAKCAHVIGIEPFANRADNVEPSLKQITVIFDKPLNADAGYSINYGVGGKDHYPVVGKPAFEDGGLRLLIPVQLTADQKYSFVLTSLAFITADGYPLVNYTVEFSTK